MVADVVILDDDDKACVIRIDDISSDSTPLSPLPIDGGRKRKLVVSSKVLAKKPNKNASPSALDLVDDISSSITEKKVVRSLFKAANISSTEYEFLVPSKDQRANMPPEGYLAVYAEQIAAGLRFPMHDMVVRVCNLMKVSPSQLMPNAHRMIVAFILCATFYGIPLTEGYFFSLFSVGSAKANGLFYIGPIRGTNFISDKLSDCGPWKKKFFFLRRKGSSWNCITKWSETFLRPAFDSSLAEFAVEKGITDHHFRVKELTCKELLVHGGIEPGVPTPEFTFRYLMHKAAVTKFDLLPEDKPHAPMPNEAVETPPFAAHNNPPTLTASAASPDQPSAEQSVNHLQSLLPLTHTEFPSATMTPIREHLSVPSEDNIPLNYLFGKEKQNNECGSREARVETNSMVTVSDVAKHQSFPTGLHTLQQILESTYVPKDQYQKLEKDAQVLSSELAYAKSRIEELEQELELSDAKRFDCEHKSYLANEAMKNFERRDRIRDSELAYTKSQIQELERELDISRVDFEKRNCLATEATKKLEKVIEDIRRTHDSKSRIQELETELRVSEAKRADLENRNYLANDAMKNLEKRVENIKSDSEKIVKDATEAVRVVEKRVEDLKSDSERYRDQIAKDAIQAFKSSEEFLNASTYYMDAFDVNFLNIPTDECDKSSGAIKSAQCPGKL